VSFSFLGIITLGKFKAALLKLRDLNLLWLG
jgi:hypothetical protein